MAPSSKSPKPPAIIAFDLYGTLLNTATIATDLASALDIPADRADDLAARWRQLQLEYTWRLAAMASPGASTSTSTGATSSSSSTGNANDALPPAHLPFARVTRAALVHAAREAGLHQQLSPARADGLMRAYDGLTSFADVLPALRALRDRTAAGAVDALVFSNGDPDMLARSVATSPTLRLFCSSSSSPSSSSSGGGGGDGNGEGPAVVKKEEDEDEDRKVKKEEEEEGAEPPLFRKLISVGAAGHYKPARDAYEHLVREATAGRGGDYKMRAAVWLVSSNAFDVLGARAAGLRAAWVDRAGTGWVDQLGELISEAGGSGAGGRRDLTPTIVVKGVDEAVAKILEVGV